MKILIVFGLLVSFSSAAENYVYIKAGTFWMGSPDSEEGRFENEVLHQETISHDFEIAQFEVTQAEWLQLMGHNPSYFRAKEFCPNIFINGMCPNFPVENVSWEDVQIFIQQKNRQNDGYIYRLPTEAEWEYVARAGTQTPYYFGSNSLELTYYEWYRENSNEGTDYRQTRTVGTKLANPWGLYDMLGNISEWVQTRYEESQFGESYVVRGGSWVYDAWNARAAYRGSDEKSNRSNTQGFRLVRTKR